MERLLLTLERSVAFSYQAGKACKVNSELSFRIVSLGRARWVFPPSGTQFIHQLIGRLGFPGSSTGEESACNAGDLGSIPVSGSSPG